MVKCTQKQIDKYKRLFMKTKKAVLLCLISVIVSMSLFILLTGLTRWRDPSFEANLEALSRREYRETQCWDLYNVQKEVDMRYCKTCCKMFNVRPSFQEYYKYCYSPCD